MNGASDFCYSKIKSKNDSALNSHNGRNINTDGIEAVMILDALIGGFLLVGLILGLKLGLKQAAGLAAVILGVQIGALASSALLGWLILNFFGSADYYVRTCSFFGFLLLGLILGIRLMLNKLAHGEGKPLPAVVNHLGGALFGLLAGFSGFHAAFLFAIQLPVLAAPLAPQFADREDAGAAQGAILPVVVNILSKGFEPLHSSIQPNPAASVFLSAVAGRIAGDYHACQSSSYRQGNLDPVTLFMKFSVFTEFYTRQSLHKNSPWLASAISNIQKLGMENQSGLLQKSNDVFLHGSVEEMNFFLAAVGVVQSPEFERVKLEGDEVRRTVGWAEKYKKDGETGRAIRIYQSYLKGNRSSRYRERIASDAAAVGMAVASTNRNTSSPDQTVAPQQPAPLKNTPGDILKELKSFRFKAAVAMSEELLRYPEVDKGVADQMLRDSVRLQALHRKLLQQIQKLSRPLTLKIPGTEQTAIVVTAFEGSVALKAGELVKTVAWKNFQPAELLVVYESLVAEEKDGLAVFKRIFEL